MAIFNSSCAEYANPVTVITVPNQQAPAVAGSSRFIADYVPPNRDSANNRAGFIHVDPAKKLCPQRKVAECFLMHGELFWFEHIHLIPINLSLGTVLTTVERTYELYNAYRTQAHTLNSITRNNADGLTFAGEPDASPRELGVKSGVTVTVTVSPVGPVTINATVAYLFSGVPVTKTLTITGTRVVIAAMEPEAEVQEVWSYKTDIFTAGNGNEYRQSIRDVPRQRLRYRYIKEDQDLAGFLNQLWGWHENIWGVPVWHDYTELTADIAAGVTSIPVADALQRDFRAGSAQLAIIWTDKDTFEAVEVASFTATEIVTAQSTLSAHSENALVMPLRTARLPKGYQLQNSNVNVRSLTVDWAINDNAALPVPSPHPVYDGGVYRGLPVWNIESDYLVTAGSYSEREDKDLRIFPDNLGKLSMMTNRDYPLNQLGGLSMQAFGREQFYRLRNFLHYFRGRQKSCWVSTGREDFRIESTQTTGSSLVNVEPVNYTDLIADAPDGPTTRRHIEIKYIDGSKDFRRIDSSQITAGVREVLTLDSAITQDASLANVERISYLVKRRLTSDDIQFEHEFYEGEVMVPGIGLIDVYDGE